MHQLNHLVKEMPTKKNIYKKIKKSKQTFDPSL